MALGITVMMLGIIFGLAKLSPETKSPAAGLPERKMTLAGTFYPKEREVLNQQMDKYLGQATKMERAAPMRILMVPHAGLDYSGPTGGAGFKQIEGETINQVIIVGTSHYHQFSGAAIMAEGEWETPMGNSGIDSQLANKILSPEQKITADTKMFDKEQSIEVPAVWVKKTLPEAKIVPILIGLANNELVSALAYRIAQNMSKQTLVVVSTDLSHYPDYQNAVKTDQRTIEAILSGSKTGLELGIAEITKSQVKNLETTACGYEALRVAEKVAELLALDEPVLIKYQNSGDTSGDKTRVVGYAAIGFTGENISLVPPQLEESAQEEAREIAKQTLEDYVRNKKIPGERPIKNEVLNDPLGAFVTLDKNDNLRGCMGEFEPAKPLYKIIQERTIAAASSDPRFRPVSPDELGEISLEISVMTPRQKIADWKEIELGKDGVVIVQGNHSGTFLPQVATETGWKLEELLGQLCSQKAGLPANCYLDGQTELFTYQAQVF